MLKNIIRNITDYFKKYKIYLPISLIVEETVSIVEQLGTEINEIDVHFCANLTEYKIFVHINCIKEFKKIYDNIKLHKNKYQKIKIRIKKNTRINISIKKIYILKMKKTYEKYL
jgi:hypothetical protein